MTIVDRLSCDNYIDSEADLKIVEESIQNCIRLIERAQHQTTVFGDFGIDVPNFEDAEALVVKARDKITERLEIWSKGDDL